MFFLALQEGTVLAFDPSSGDVKIKLTKASLKKTQGMFWVTCCIHESLVFRGLAFALLCCIVFFQFSREV